MSRTPTLTERFADLATAVPDATATHAAARMALYVLDTLAVSLGGSRADSSQPVTRTILAAAGKAESTVLGVGRVTSAWDAALANGAYAHALELDDDHRVAVLHPGAVVVPAALAACEAAGTDGQTFLRACLLGYEITCRLGMVFRGSQFYHGVHPTALCGVFGAAAAAGVAIGLDREAVVRALGIAGTQASGLTEWRADGSWIKRLHPGRAAHAGILAARLAANGFTGPSTILEGDNGFFNAFGYGEPLDVEAVTRDLGRRFEALGTAIKPYPCCRFEHGAIDLALEAWREGLRGTDIAETAVRIYRTDVLSYHRTPRNAVDAQFNVPYAVAVALTRGAVTLHDFSEQAIRDERVLELAQRVEVVEDEAYSRRYPAEYCVELVVRTRAGASRRYFSDCPSGDPDASRYAGRPELLRQEVEAKCRAVLEECGFGDRAEMLVRAVGALPGAESLAELAAALGAPQDQPAVHMQKRSKEESAR